jgi:hypothetical protein
VAVTFQRRSALLGTGVLRWPPDKDPDNLGKTRVDLARTVGLMTVGNRWVRFNPDLDGDQVVLLAIVTDLRGPVLRWDPVRAIGPRHTFVGEAVNLGTGQLFCLDAFGERASGVGVMPADPVADSGDWLDRAALYRAHNHIVELRAVRRRSHSIALHSKRTRPLPQRSGHVDWTRVAAPRTQPTCKERKDS